MRDVYRYTACLDVLRDDFETRRTADPRVTLRVYAKTLGIGPSALHMILSGKRNLTVALVQRAAVSLRLSPPERDHLEMLFLREQAAGDELRAHYDRKLRSAKAASPTRRIRRADKQLLAQWQVPVLLVWIWDVLRGAELGRISGHVPALARHLGMPKDRLEALLDDCRCSGLSEVGADGRTHLLLDGIGRQIPQKLYLRQVLQELERRIERRFHDPHHLFRAFTFSVDRARIPELRADLNALLERYMDRGSGGGTTDAVVTAFFGLFPGLSGPLAESPKPTP